MPPNPIPCKPVNNALEKYAIVLPYLAYENSTFWNRSGFFLVAHTALLTFVTTNGLPVQSNTQDKHIAFLVIGAVGIILGIAWILAIAASKYWINKWHDVLLVLEPDAFGDLQVLRGNVWSKGNVSQCSRPSFWAHIGGKYITILIAVIFTSAWIGLLARIFHKKEGKTSINVI